MNSPCIPPLLSELEALQDAEASVLITLNRGEFQLILNIAGELHRIGNEDYLDAIAQARRILADQRGEDLDAVENNGKQPQPILHFSTHRRKQRRSPTSLDGGDAA